MTPGGRRQIGIFDSRVGGLLRPAINRANRFGDAIEAEEVEIWEPQTT